MFLTSCAKESLSKHEIVADIVWVSSVMFLRRLKLTIYNQRPKVEQTTKKIFGWPARYAMPTKARKLMALILSPNGKFRSLTRADKVGKDILSWSTESRLSARQRSDARLLSPYK